MNQTVKGAFTCEVSIGKNTEQAEFIVIRESGEPLLGKETSMRLGVLRVDANIAAITSTKQTLQQQYPEEFSGVEKLKTRRVSLHQGSATLGTRANTGTGQHNHWLFY